MIYFIQIPAGGPVKIGYTGGNDALTRLATLQVGSPVPLAILGVIEGSLVDEQAWHTRFAEDRLHGEWFRPSRELARAIGVQLQLRDAPVLTGEPIPVPSSLRQKEPRGRRWMMASEIQLDQRVCRCGYPMHWHGAADPERPAETMGLSGCDSCDCEAMEEVRTDTLWSLRHELAEARAALAPSGAERVTDAMVEALEAAEEFIERVERWSGSDPDECHEILATVRTALTALEAHDE